MISEIMQLILSIPSIRRQVTKTFKSILIKMRTILLLKLTAVKDSQLLVIPVNNMISKAVLLRELVEIRTAFKYMMDDLRVIIG